MKVSISHDTRYHYDDRVPTSIQYLRVTPHDTERQRVLDWQLKLPHPVRAQLDPFGNILHVLSLDEPHDSVVISSRGQVEIDEAREAEHDRLSPLPFLRFTRLTQADPALRAFAEEHCQLRRDREALIGLMQALSGHIDCLSEAFDREADSSAAEAFAKGKGRSRDQVHAFLACVRSQGIPARFVSGYRLGDSKESLISHAWAEAWLEDAWYSFDISNGLARPDRHLKLAVGLDYLDACPVRGMYWGLGSEALYAHIDSAALVRAQ